MYCSLFGSCSFPRSRTCNCSPRPLNQQNNNAGRYTSPKTDGRPHPGTENRCGKPCCSGCLMLKEAAFGGLVLPGGTEKGATFHVVSLNLDTSGCKKFLVQLNFSCNPIANGLKARLRFRVVRQDMDQYLPVPVSAGILYCRDREGSGADSFTLSVCDHDSTSSRCCSYRVYVEAEEFGPEGTLIIANPSLIATIVNTD